jgi:hypothetical protein
VRRFDEDGWEASRNVWWKRWSKGRTLPQFIADELDMPAAAAAALTEEIVTTWPTEWKRRGGTIEHYRRSDVAPLFGCLAAVVLFAVIGMVEGIWLLVT